MKIIQVLFLLLITVGCVRNKGIKIPVEPVRIVILGSSTAQGIGASRPDSTWVGRVRAYFGNTKQIINLAKGGYTSYQMRQSGATVVPQRPAPDTARNISKALTYQPDALILSMTTNDVSAGFALADYFDNVDQVIALARAEGVQRVYVTTSLPRSSVDFAKRQILSQQRQQTLARYGGMAIDLWVGFEGDSLKLNPKYDSGDKIHLNDAGHRILAQRFVEVLKQTSPK